MRRYNLTGLVGYSAGQRDPRRKVDLVIYAENDRAAISQAKKLIPKNIEENDGDWASEDHSYFADFEMQLANGKKQKFTWRPFRPYQRTVVWKGHSERKAKLILE